MSARSATFCALVLLAVSCSTTPAPTGVSTQLTEEATEIATSAPTSTVTPAPTSSDTAAPNATETPISTPTATPTATPMPTPNPFAVPLTIGGARALARSSILEPAAPPPGKISPLFFGTNYWRYPWPDPIPARIRALNLTMLRWGGTNLDQASIDLAALDNFILTCRRINAEPLIQVPMFEQEPASAARLVAYANLTKKYDVRYWAIGNELDKYHGGSSAAEIDSYNQQWRAFYAAMIAVDPRIVLVGPDLAWSGTPDAAWLASFLKANGDLVGMVSLHYYPFNGNQENIDALTGNALALGKFAAKLRGQIRTITGRDVPLAFTEINIQDNYQAQGEGSGASFSAGMWLAETIGQFIDAGVTMMNVWSAYRDAGLATVGSLPRANLRPTYYALAVYSEYGDTIVSTESRVPRVSGHASRSSRTEKVTLVLINRGFAAQSLNIVFNTDPDGTPNSILLNSTARTSKSWMMPPQSFAVLIYDGNFRLIQSREYDRARFQTGLAPQVTHDPQSSGTTHV